MHEFTSTLNLVSSDFFIDIAAGWFGAVFIITLKKGNTYKARENRIRNVVCMLESLLVAVIFRLL